MKSLADRVDEYLTGERALSSLLDTPITLSQIVAATKIYAGYAEMEAHIGVVAPIPEISGTLEINESEWAVIKPLFILYVEREEAFQLEASRSLGIEPFGRSSSEIGQDIELYITEKMPRLAFSQAIETV